MRRSLLDLGPRGRVVFAVFYIGLLGAAIAYSQASPDHVFGFQMFNESSTLRIRLFREVKRGGRPRLVRVVDGQWRARDRARALRTHRWQDRVRTGPIRTLDRFVHASYGLDAQLFRLERALEDVVSHIPHDRETRALVAVVDTVRNGRTARTVRLRAVRP
jgi:hypothetical protein